MLAFLKRQIRRPFVAMAIILGGIFLIFPKFGPSTVTFRHHLPSCAEKLTVSARDISTRQVVRSTSQVVRGLATLEHEFTLPKGQYLLRIEVECQKGDPGEVERTLVLDKSGAIDFELADECAC